MLPCVLNMCIFLTKSKKKKNVCICSYDNIISCLSETLADLEKQYTKREFKMNKLKCNYEQQLFIKMELWKKEEVRLINFNKHLSS